MNNQDYPIVTLTLFPLLTNARAICARWVRVRASPFQTVALQIWNDEFQKTKPQLLKQMPQSAHRKFQMMNMRKQAYG